MSGFAGMKMGRREFVKAGVAAGLGAAVRAKSQAKKPNVLYVFIHATANETHDADEEGKAGGKTGPPQGPIFRGVRTDQYTYAVNENGRWVLYDNFADPYQLKNLVEDARHKERMGGFDAQIKTWMQHTGDPFSYPTAG